ncbi:C13 family peptidase [Arenimonas daejeonensis]|uniref:C13 family peptidase n=1 Tax=Arenimonas daejeonensis TaxID=370777 RepID=UPI00223FA62B|nr:C13 family peptidase [Arenimonas daejeonensis]
MISACYSGGFARALGNRDSLLLMAARRDRPSFGCGNDSVATYFGRAWLVDGLNDTVDFVQAFEQARLAIERREIAEGLLPSLPQINRGARIDTTLAAWRAGFTPGPALPYPHAEPEPEDVPEKIIPPRLPTGKSGSR